MLSDTFTSLSSALNSFRDDPISLGTLDGPTDLTLYYDLTASSAMGAGIDYVLGYTPATAPVPVPPTLPLLLGGLIGLAFAGWRSGRGTDAPRPG